MGIATFPVKPRGSGRALREQLRYNGAVRNCAIRFIRVIRGYSIAEPAQQRAEIRNRDRMPDEIRAIPTGTGRQIKIKPEKRFDRLDKPFNDAVRAKKESSVTNVLLRKQLSGDLASRTAKKVLASKVKRKN